MSNRNPSCFVGLVASHGETSRSNFLFKAPLSSWLTIIRARGSSTLQNVAPSAKLSAYFGKDRDKRRELLAGLATCIYRLLLI